MFYLNGSSLRKFTLLTVGNFVGLFWNYLFFQLYLALSPYTLFDAFYAIIFPLLNLMWVVPFWSLSLGVLPKMQTANTNGVP